MVVDERREHWLVEGLSAASKSVFRLRAAYSRAFDVVLDAV